MEPSVALSDDLEGWEGAWLGRLGREGRRKRMYVKLWLICIVVWQKTTQHCKKLKNKQLKN